MAVAVLIVIVSICVWLGMPKFKGIQRLTDNVNKIARENINGLRVIRAYNAEGYQEEKFERANTIIYLLGVSWPFCFQVLT